MDLKQNQAKSGKILVCALFRNFYLNQTWCVVEKVIISFSKTNVYEFDLIMFEGTLVFETKLSLFIFNIYTYININQQISNKFSKNLLKFSTVLKTSAKNF